MTSTTKTIRDAELAAMSTTDQATNIVPPEIKDGPRYSSFASPNSKPFIGRLERELFKAMQEVHSAFSIMKQIAGKDARFTLEQAEQVTQAEKLFYEAMTNCRNSRAL